MRARRTACHALFLATVVAACLTAMTRAEALSRGYEPPAPVVRAGT